MATPILICDDSKLARKQLARALPDSWDIDISFAVNGLDCIENLGVDVRFLFLDLNMPEMDGYEVLQWIQDQGIDIDVVVVSGDIQLEAQRRVMDLGALAFIKKPVNMNELIGLLQGEGISFDSQSLRREQNVEVNVQEYCQEIANIAMGQAASLLAQVLDAFVLMPVPKVNNIEGCELHMVLAEVQNKDAVSAVCQGFIGSGIAGEALMIFHDASYDDMAKLMNYEADNEADHELELLMDLANLLIGVCIKGIADQLGTIFSQGHPVVLGRHTDIASLIERNTSKWDKILTIEMSYAIEGHNINCDLLLLFTEDSIQAIETRMPIMV